MFVNRYEGSNAMQYLLWYHLFGFLWTNALIDAISMCTVAGAVSAYYWAKQKKTGEQRTYSMKVLTQIQ